MTSLSWGGRAEREQLKSELLGIEPKPVHVGRFVVAGKLGAGATGVVLEAYDPQLERGVALKIIRSELADDAEFQERLQREAKALARLSHPNVVSVFEVGQHEQSTFVVMELLRGSNLRVWLSQEARPWREVLEVFLAAGDGLAAAHASGLVHRDFKPENVLFTDEGVAKVVDFGLVGLRGNPTSQPESDARLTERPVGTRQYMAPEQLSQGPVDPLADQFSFCVALGEALTEHVGGSRPPRAVLDAIERGQSPQTRDRWPTLDSLLDTLRRRADARARKRRGWALGIVGAAGLVAAVAAAGNDGAEACSELKMLGTVWGPSERNAIRGRDGGSHVADRLDAYADRWRTATEQTCRTRPPQGTDRRFRCLQHRLVTLDTFVRSLPDGGLLPAVVLPAPEACLRQDENPEPSEAVADALARARGAFVAGDYERTRDFLRVGTNAAEHSNDEAATGDLQHAHGHLAEVEGRYEDAIESYAEGFVSASRAGRSDVALRSAAGAVNVEAQYRSNMERAEVWADLGGRLNDPSASLPESRMIFVNAIAGLHTLRGRYDRAVALATEGIEQARTLPDVNPTLRLLATRAAARERLQDFEGSVEDFHAALQLAHATYGEDHYVTVELETSLSSALRHHGDLDGAAEALERALDFYVDHQGEGGADTGLARLNLSAVRADQGQFEAAAKLLEGLPELFDAALGPDHPWTTITLRNQCLVGLELGPSPERLPDCRRALEVSLRVNGPAHYDTGMAMIALADALREEDDRDAEAEAYVRKAVEILDPDYPLDGADARRYLARILHDAGRNEEAIEQLKQVTSIEADDPALREIVHAAGVMLQEIEGA